MGLSVAAPHLRIAALLLLATASIMVPAQACADDTAVIASLENGSSDTEVRQRYAAWLEANAGHEEYVPVLRRFSALYTNPVEAAQALLRYAPGIADSRRRADEHERAAELLELAGRLPQAQQAYARAYELSDKVDCRSLLRSASLLFELGQWEQAQAQVRELVGGCEGEETLGAVMVLQARLFAALDRRDEAVALVRRLLPRDPPLVSAAVLYGFHRVATQLGAVDLARESADRLSREFPESPEAAMLGGEYAEAVTAPAAPSFLLGVAGGGAPKAGADSVADEDAATQRDHHQAVAIQTGSFRQEGNAIRQRDRLDALGFRVTLVHPNGGGDAYYKVVVPVAGQSTERLIIALKEHGFEGFPLYDDE